jgi:hypothetical protein
MALPPDEEDCPEMTATPPLSFLPAGAGWACPAESGSGPAPLAGSFYLYREDCVDGVSRERRAQVTIAAGVMTQGPWQYVRNNGCCDCLGGSGPGGGGIAVPAGLHPTIPVTTAATLGSFFNSLVMNNPPAGLFLVVGVAERLDSGPSTLAIPGWATLCDGVNTNLRLRVFWKVSNGSEPFVVPITGTGFTPTSAFYAVFTDAATIASGAVAAGTGTDTSAIPPVLPSGGQAFTVTIAMNPSHFILEPSSGLDTRLFPPGSDPVEPRLNAGWRISGDTNPIGFTNQFGFSWLSVVVRLWH